MKGVCKIHGELMNCTDDTLKCPRCGANDTLRCPRCSVRYKEMDGYIYGFCRECAKYILNQYDAKEVS